MFRGTVLLLLALHGGALRSADPRLPAVAEMLNASSRTLGRINSQVSKMSSHMADVADQQHQALAQLKADYEGRLAAEDGDNKVLTAVNERTSQEIWQLEKGNAKLRQQAKALQAQNADLRKALNTVQDKVGAAGDYVNGTLDATNDKGAPSLQVLAQAKATVAQHAADDKVGDADADAGSDVGSDADEGTVDDAGAADDAKDKGADAEQDTPPKDDQDGEDGESLIAIRSRHRALRGKRTRDAHESDSEEEDAEDSEADDEQQDGASVDDTEDLNATQAARPQSPDDHVSQSLIHSLSEELEQLDKQDAQSRKQMEKLFNSEFSKEKKEQAKILEKQMALNGTRTSLTEVQHGLQDAVHHLEGTQAQLKTRLQGLGKYLQQLSAFALKPAPEAEQLIPSLPGDVSAFLQEERRATERLHADAKVTPAAH